ncbi:MAG: gamma-glutamyl-gamma-aminobutyrate hydrolase family protein [Bacteroidetes bacterium]|nr:gamma-glutamyl-gamma-aminobutyrate hydrolase family protein [Bacteroidota bacterium]
MRIGLTYTGSEKKHLNYVNWLKGDDAIEVVELSAGKNNLDELHSCDGLVLSGGIDVHPKFYNNSELNYPGVEGFDEARDQFEISAIKKAQENKLPILGICRGLQLINCFFDGSLKQDLGELNKTHKGGPDKTHEVIIDHDTLLHGISQIRNGNVNSSHHQAIDKLGQNLKVNCKANDGIIEGIERSEKGQPFLLAVQWHPERMENQNSPLSKNIRNSFLDAARKI